MHDYAINDPVFVEVTDINHKLDYNKQGTDIIKQVFTNSTFRVQRGQLNEHINIRRLMPYFVEKSDHFL